MGRALRACRSKGPRPPLGPNFRIMFFLFVPLVDPVGPIGPFPLFPLFLPKLRIAVPRPEQELAQAPRGDQTPKTSPRGTRRVLRDTQEEPKRPPRGTQEIHPNTMQTGPQGRCLRTRAPRVHKGPQGKGP